MRYERPTKSNHSIASFVVHTINALEAGATGSSILLTSEDLRQRRPRPQARHEMRETRGRLTYDVSTSARPTGRSSPKIDSVSTSVRGPAAGRSADAIDARKLTRIGLANIDE